MPIQEDYFTPDSIRDKELKDLRSKLRKANIVTWVLFFVGLMLGVFIARVWTALWR